MNYATADLQEVTATLLTALELHYPGLEPLVIKVSRD